MIVYESWDILHHLEFNYFDDNENLNWANHFHRAYECVSVNEGEMLFTVDSREYLLKKGDAVLVMPNQFHSVSTEKYSSFRMLRFLPNIAGSFYTACAGRLPDTNKFRAPKVLMSEFEYPQNVYLQKSLVYGICGEFCRQVRNWHDAFGGGDLLSKILLLVEKNFTEDCSLKSIAKQLGYDYTYLSKFFLKSTGTTFVYYINDCRINHACYLAANSDLSMSEIAHECGYNSIRSFNRNFLCHAGTTPVKYRRSMAKTTVNA